MITSVGTVSVFVSDQDCAKEFYTDVLGFELRTEAPSTPGQQPGGWPSLQPGPRPR
jgi:catechol 2,3-dioxygenase-like lactoylglutathione lyase family enzyme